MESKCSDRKLGSSVDQLTCAKRKIVLFKLSPLGVNTKTVLHFNECDKICV
jgi:hypothetical protein